MPNYSIRISDFNSVASAASTMYSFMYGTPAADILYDIHTKFNDAFTKEPYGDLDDPEEELKDDKDREIYNKVFKHRGNGFASKVNDEDYKWKNLDKDLRDFQRRIRAELASDRYEKGSFKRSFLEYMEMQIDSAINRNMKFSSELASEGNYSKVYPALDAIGKFAAFNVIPKRSREELEGMKPDDADNNFTPQYEQSKARLTEKELEDGARKLNLTGIYHAAIRNVKTQKEIYDQIAAERIDTKEQDAILRNRLIGEIVNTRNELLKAYYVDPGDKTILAVFNNTKDMEDALGLTTARGFKDNIRILDLHEKYLKSGFPIIGFGEYQGMLKAAGHLENLIKKIKLCYVDEKGVFDDHQNIIETLIKKLENLPPENASDRERTEWQRNVQESFKAAVDTFESLQKEKFVNKEADNGVFRAGLESLQKKTAHVFTDQTSNEYKAYIEIKNVLPTMITNLGKKSLEELRNERTEFIRGIGEDALDLSKSLKDLKSKNRRNYSKGINTAIDSTIAVLEKGNKARPDELESAIQKLKGNIDAEAGRTGANEKAGEGRYDELNQWAVNADSYISNKISALETRGMFKEEVIETQLELAGNHGRLNLKRHTREFGAATQNESKLHKEVRERAERLNELDEEYWAVNREENPEKWEEKAAEYMSAAILLASACREYQLSDEEKYNSAEMLYKDAENTRLAMTVKLTSKDKYKKIQENTIDPEPIDAALLEKNREELKRTREEAEKKEEERITRENAENERRENELNNIIKNEWAEVRRSMYETTGNAGKPVTAEDFIKTAINAGWSDAKKDGATVASIYGLCDELMATDFLYDAIKNGISDRARFTDDLAKVISKNLRYFGANLSDKNKEDIRKICNIRNELNPSEEPVEINFDSLEDKIRQEEHLEPVKDDNLSGTDQVYNEFVELEKNGDIDAIVDKMLESEIMVYEEVEIQGKMQLPPEKQAAFDGYVKYREEIFKKINGKDHFEPAENPTFTAILQKIGERGAGYQYNVGKEKEELEADILDGKVRYTAKIKGNKKAAAALANGIVNKRSKDAMICDAFNNVKKGMTMDLPEVDVKGIGWLNEWAFRQVEYGEKCYKAKILKANKSITADDYLRMIVRGDSRNGNDYQKYGYEINADSTSKQIFSHIPADEEIMGAENVQELEAFVAAQINQSEEISRYQKMAGDIIEAASEKLNRLAGMNPIIGKHNDGTEFKKMKNKLSDLAGMSSESLDVNDLISNLSTLRSRATTYKESHNGLFKAAPGYGADRYRMAEELINFVDGLKGKIDEFTKLTESVDKLHKEQKRIFGNIEKAEEKIKKLQEKAKEKNETGRRKIVYENLRKDGNKKENTDVHKSREERKELKINSNKQNIIEDELQY